jgi:hypothetical protein
MQSTKYVLLLLAVLAFAAMDVADDINAHRCKDLSRTTAQQCDACCILLSLEYNFNKKYSMAAAPWDNDREECVCIEITTDYIPSQDEILHFFNLLGHLAPVLDLNRPAASHTAPAA